MPAKPKRAAKKSPTDPKKAEVDDEEIDEMDADELALIFPSTPFQASGLKFAEN